MQAVYASGTAYVLTGTPAKVTFGTQSPEVSIPRQVTRTILARAVIDLSGCTLDSPRTVTMKLRRTSGTAADLANSSVDVVAGIIGTSGTNEVDIPIELPPVIHATGKTRDTIELWASISSTPTSGQVRIRSASILVE